MSYRPTRVGHIVGLDLHFMKDNIGQPPVVLQHLVMATLFNVGVVCETKEPHCVDKPFKANWLQWLGVPEKTHCWQKTA